MNETGALRGGARVLGHHHITGTTTPRPPHASTSLPDERLRYLAPQIHQLGPRPLFELFREVRDGAPLAVTLEAYGRLPADFIHALGGDRMPKLCMVSS
jgi:hypothetical protein